MISVVIPVYNGEKFLAETYETLCGSEEKDLELLFVNDGSTDKSAELPLRETMGCNMQRGNMSVFWIRMILSKRICFH